MDKHYPGWLRILMVGTCIVLAASAVGCGKNTQPGRSVRTGTNQRFAQQGAPARSFGTVPPQRQQQQHWQTQRYQGLTELEKWRIGFEVNPRADHRDRPDHPDAARRVEERRQEERRAQERAEELRRADEERRRQERRAQEAADEIRRRQKRL